MNNTIYTIGYTGFTTDAFIKALNKHNINVVIDVRSSPYSERYADYNKSSLERFLKENNIYYRNYIKEFGARQEDPRYLSSEGYLDFDLFMKSPQFQEGVNKIVNSVNQGYNIVFLCAEKKPIMCHRTILVSRAFHNLGYNIVHIMQNEETVTQSQIEEDLLTMYFPSRNQFDLFSPRVKSDGEYLASAYKLQNKAIGYHPEEK